MPKLTPYVECKIIFAKYIRDSDNIPSDLKPLVKQYVNNLIDDMLNNIERIKRSVKEYE